MVTFVPEWSRPSTILVAAEWPANEKAFTLALAQAKESDASLIILHVCGETADLPFHNGDGQSLPHQPADLFGPMVQHATELGIHCQVEVRKGLAAQEILRFLAERRVDRIVMGVHTPGRIGKPLVGSVTETILRTSDIPVSIVGPYLRPGIYRDYLTHTILCSVSSHPSRKTVARLAAELASCHRARLVLQYVIPPQESDEELARQPLDQMERVLLDLIPARVRARLNVQATTVLGDPAEELLYLSRVTQANLIVIGAHNATHFAAVSNSGVVYKVLAYAPCPVLTLSPVALGGYGPASETIRSADVNYLPGVV